MLKIRVEDFDEGFNVELKAEGSDELIAVQLHTIIKKIIENNPDILTHMIRLEAEDSDD